MTDILGIDVAWPQGRGLPWDKIAAEGVRFCWCKAGEGISGRDGTFTDHIQGARRVGILAGAYWFARPSREVGSADAQARAFHETVQLAGGVEMPPALDLEVNGGLTPREVVAWARRFVEVTEALFGRPCVVYTYPSFWQGQCGDLDDPFLAQRPLWIAHYTTMAAPMVPRPWRNRDGWTVWQYDGNGGRALPGGVDADYNRFRGTEEDLQALLDRTALVCTPA